MATPDPVRPNIPKLTDDDARHLLAPGIVKACALPNAIGGGTLGPTRVGMMIGCDEKTVRRARDEESTLGLACSWNLLDVNEHALDALAAAKGFRLSRLVSVDGPDIVSASGAVLHKIGDARDPRGPGGCAETTDELEAMEADVAMLEAAAASLRSRIAVIKLRRAA